jgi:hypothetical protein
MLKLGAALLALLWLSSAAEARHHHHHHHHRHHVFHQHALVYVANHRLRLARRHGGMPWCGLYMRHQVGRDPGPAYNLARNWAHWGVAAQAIAGAIVVWPHHVGRIVGPCRGRMCLINSGNDGGRVRTRMRSVAGAIAFRRGW